MVLPVLQLPVFVLIKDNSLKRKALCRPRSEGCGAAL